MFFENLFQKIDNNLNPIFNYGYYNRKSQFIDCLKNIISGRNIVNNFSLLLKYFYIYLTLPFYFLLSIIFLFLKVKFFIPDLSQIGSVLWLDLFLKEIKTNGNYSKYKYFIPKQKNYKFANNQLIKLYENELKFIDSFFLRLIMLPLFHINFITINTIRFEVDFRSSYAHLIWRKSNHNKIEKYINKNINDKFIKILEIESKINYKKYVTIHVRDSGFYNEKNRATRNADIDTYVNLINKIQKLGFSVVKIGDKFSKKIDIKKIHKKEKYFDYAHSKIKSEINDILIIINSSFHIATPSGLSFIPMIFNKKTYWTNMNTCSQSLGYNYGDITIFKKIKNKKNFKYINFESYFEEPFDHNNQIKDFDYYGYISENNTSNELVKCFDDFYDLNFSNKKINDSEIQNFMNSTNYSYFAEGKFSKKFIDIYKKL